MRPPVRVLPVVVVALAVASCGGGDRAVSGEPPWGLVGIEMPDTEEAVAGVLAALPAELDGRVRSADPTGGVVYEGRPIFWRIGVWSPEDIQMMAPEGADWDPVDWLSWVASTPVEGVTVEASAVEPYGDLLWVAYQVREGLSPQDEPAYMFAWAQPGGLWTFVVQADSDTRRRALVELFVAACESAGLAAAHEMTTTMSTSPPAAGPTASTLPPSTSTSTPTTTWPVEALAADDPELFLAELEALRESAGAGRIVGMVHLLDPDHTYPLAETQPFCVGAGDFEDVAPGVVVALYGDGAAEPQQTAILRGSVADAHTGCGLWFGTDVVDADSYTIVIGDHSVTFDAGSLSGAGWIVNLWSDPRALQAECEENPTGELCNFSTVIE